MPKRQSGNKKGKQNNFSKLKPLAQSTDFQKKKKKQKKQKKNRRNALQKTRNQDR